MAGAKVTVQAEGGPAVLDALERLRTIGQRMKPVFADIGEYLLQSHDERWDAQVSPDGVPWRPLDPDYADWKKEHGKSEKILILDQYLKLLHYEATDDGLELGTDRVYGAIHQFGSDGPTSVPAHSRTITQAFGKPLKKPVTFQVKAYSFDPQIPARPFLGISAADGVEILDILNGWLEEQWKT